MPDGRFRLPDVTDAVPSDLWTVIDQREALTILSAVGVGRRADRRANHDAVCRALVGSMRRGAGAITVSYALVGERAAELLGRETPLSHKTVARIVADLIHAGVFVCLEQGASAAVLRSRVNRAATFAVVRERTAADDEAEIAAKIAALKARLEQGSEQGEHAKCPPNPVTVGDMGSGREIISPSLNERSEKSNLEVSRSIRAELRIGFVPAWRVNAMLARHYAAGLDAAELLEMILTRPNATEHPPLPAGDELKRRTDKGGPSAADVILGTIGFRLNLWTRRGLRPSAVVRTVRDLAPPPPVVLGEAGQQARYEARATAIAAARRAAAAKPRRAAVPGPNAAVGSSGDGRADGSRAWAFLPIRCRPSIDSLQ